MSVPQTNADKLPMISVQGSVAPPMHRGGHGFDADGKLFLLPGTGGITYNIHVGDPAFGWAADHIEPAVSAMADAKDREGGANSGFNVYACAGNEAILVSGKVEGKKGTVIGHHGGAEHVIIEFDEKTLNKMTMDDKILIKGYGQGLQFTDYPEICAYNLDPRIIKRWGINDSGKCISVPVSAIVPGELMGSGVGHTSMGRSDYDIMTMDKDYISELKLNKIRFGDIVAITDHDNRYGRSFRRGAITIGIVIHGDCKWAGHGPGVTTLMSTVKPGLIKLVKTQEANIGKFLKIGRFAK